MDVDTTNMTTLPALKAVTATDQGGILAIAASMALVFAILSLLVRAYVRIECSAAFAKDDLVSCLSMVSSPTRRAAKKRKKDIDRLTGTRPP